MVKYRVQVYCAANDLNGMVEVISLTKKSAGEMALRVFFKGSGWKVHEVKQIEEL